VLPLPTNTATSSSKSTRGSGMYLTSASGVALTCPHGLRASVPDTTMLDARPWYATGRCVQLGISALSLPRNIVPTFTAWLREA
jgi:hypothetical protein